MIDYIFGAYILENMTTGMYRDSVTTESTSKRLRSD